MNPLENDSMTQTRDTGKPSLRRLVAGGGAFLLWLLLTGSLAPAELIVGAAVALATAMIAAPRLALLDDIRWGPRLPWAVGRYFLVFAPALVRANLDVARRVLSPRLPLDPAVVTVRTSLASPLGLLLLANSITLTPGTLTIDVREDLIDVHWIDGASHAGHADIESATLAIVTALERPLREIAR